VYGKAVGELLPHSEPDTTLQALLAELENPIAHTPVLRLPRATEAGTGRHDKTATCASPISETLIKARQAILGASLGWE